MILRRVRHLVTSLRDPTERPRLMEEFSHSIVWSNLARLGRAKVMRMTILVPIIGVFIIFNEGLLHIFRLDSFFLRDAGLETQTAIDDFTVGNLYFLYFGLSALGFASFIFGIWCPSEIRDHASVMEYVNATELDKNSVVAKSHLQDVLNLYFDRDRNVDRDYLPPNPEYPNKLELQFYNLISEMFQHSPDEVSEEPENNTPSDEDEHDGSLNFYLASGYPDIHQIAYTVWSNPKVVWSFTIPFRSLSVQFSKDISYVRYNGLDYSRFKARIGVSAFYAIGLTLVFIPTLKTFFRLTFRLFERLLY